MGAAISNEQIQIHLKAIEARLDGIERRAKPLPMKNFGPAKPLAEQTIGYLPGATWKEFGYLKGTPFAEAPIGFLHAYASALEEGLPDAKYPESDEKRIVEVRAMISTRGDDEEGDIF